MNQSNNNPYEEWRKIFESASETPPPGIWDAIEKQLDEQAEAPAPVPLWRSPATWLSAASLLLLLGVGTAVYLNNESSAPANQLAGTEITAPAVEYTVPQELSIPSGEAIASVKSEDTGKNASGEVPGQPASRSESRAYRHSQERPSPGAETWLAGNATGKSVHKTASGNISPATAKISGDAPIEKTLDAINDLPLLASLPFEELETYWQTRYIFFNSQTGKVFEEEPLSKSESSPLWAAVSFMPGGYNPNMEFHHQNVYQMNNAVGSSLVSSDNSFAATNRTVTGNRDQPKISYQASAQLGVNLSKNWAIESGVSFLQGNSNSRSPGYYMNNTNTADLLANALISANTAHYSVETMKQLQLPQTESNALAVYVPKDQNVSNNYRFVQVPAYLSYTFQPEKKFSYSVLGGGVTNFFLENKLGTTSGYTLKTTPENNVYNSVSLAAAAGLRVNYRINQAWHTNLTANYQHSVTNGFKENDFLKSYPKMYGVSWGVRYTFQN